MATHNGGNPPILRYLERWFQTGGEGKMQTIDADTSLYAVIGHPVSHSLSPAMHNAAFSHTGYNGVYAAMDVTDIKGAVRGIRALSIEGVSVTIPHKVDVMPHLDAIDDLALRIGAVNTVVNSDGTLHGYNTDGMGAAKALMDQTTIKGKHVAILGAGGAARAVGFAVAAEGATLTIINRSVDKGEDLAETLGAEFVPMSNAGAIDCDILVNTTSVGMSPHTDSIPISENSIDAGMIVMDIVYNPLITRLLDAATSKGCLTVDGVAMFVYQGALQFELWTGMKAPYDVMRSEVYGILSSREG